LIGAVSDDLLHQGRVYSQSKRASSRNSSAQWSDPDEQSRFEMRPYIVNHISQENFPLYQTLRVRLFALSTIRLVIFALLMLFVATLPSVISVLLYPDFHIGGPGWGKDNVNRMILWGCVLAPLLETTVHQWACLRILEKFRVRALAGIFMSSLGFAVAHDYSVPYMLTAFLSGVILSTVFVVERKRNGSPFMTTLTVHALKNWIASAYLLLS
jgi:uncharacterized protein